MTDRVGQQLGNYTLVRLLGRGGQAEVYLGEHCYLKSSAALKVLHASLDDQHSQQFLAEAQTLARLLHPSIVRVLEFTVEQGTPVLIMDYAHEGTMRERYPLGTRVPLATVVSAVSQVASALQYAHSNHVIHRDVKPENLLLGPRDEVLLSDFGLSILAPSPELLSTQVMAGTLPYMAPEQLQGHPGFASDQYSLAIVAYEWLTGKRPFTGSQWQLIQQQLYAAPPSLRELNPSVPQAMEAVILRALAKDPGDRYVSVQGFAHALWRASPQVQHADEDAEVTAHLRLRHAALPDEPLASSHQSTQPLPSLAQPVFTQGTALPLVAYASSLQQTNTEQASSPTTDVNRKRLLAKVRAFWITGVLSHSLHGAALIALGLHEQSDAVANPWHLVLESPGEPAHALPPGTSIVQAYDEAVGELLILGEPGSGKTTLLLELVRTLLDRAERDERHPMPVVFNLSSWASKQQPLEAWLIEELNTKYQVPRKLGTVWVEADQILPLLDGLDEVAPSARAACVEAINVYRLHHGLVPTVVCSRSAEYLAQQEHVLLRKAVVVQLLTWPQVEDYLASAGEPLASVRAALQRDPGLRELVTTPLMLSVLSLAYHDTSVEDLLVTTTPQLRRQHVFAHYVERMLSRRGTDTSYPSQQTRRWLAWLARQMKQQNQTVFSLEHLQPDWLPQHLQHRRSYRTTVRMISALLIGLLYGILSGVAFGLPFGLRSGLEYGIVIGLAFGLVFSLMSRVETEIRPAEVITWSWRHLWRSLLRIEMLRCVLVGVLTCGIFSALFSVLFIFFVTGSSLVNALFLSLSVGLLFGLIATVVFRIVDEVASIMLRGSLMWSSVLVGLIFGLLGGLVIALSVGASIVLTRTSVGLVLAAIQLSGVVLLLGLLGGIVFRVTHRRKIGQPQAVRLWRQLWWNLMSVDVLRSVLAFGLTGIPLTAIGSGLLLAVAAGPLIGIIGGLVGMLSEGIVNGFSTEMLSKRTSLTPNEGIWRSARNAARAGLIGALVSGLLSGLPIGLLRYWLIGGSVHGLPYWLVGGIEYGILGGLLGGLLFGLPNGGIACLQHLGLRCLLWRAGLMPWNYPRFLDYAAEQILLRKVGGGYIFVHRFLLEFFATLQTTPPPESEGRN